MRKGKVRHHQAAELPQRLAVFAGYLGDLLPPETVPAAKRATVIKEGQAITAFLNALTRALWDAARLRVVSDGGDADSKH